MAWKDDKDRIEAKLAELESRIRALEAAPPSVDPVTPDPATPVAPVTPIIPAEPPGDPLAEAWSAIFNGSSGVQVARVNPDDKRYPPVGDRNDPPRIVVENNDSGGKVAVFGLGRDLVSAYTDYLAKGGKETGEPVEISDFELEQARVFLAGARPPSSVRKSSQGFNCDYFRSKTVHSVLDGQEIGPVGSPGLAIQELRAKLGTEF